MFVVCTSIKSKKFLKIPLLPLFKREFNILSNFFAVLLASTQACEWYNLWWSLCTMYMLWSCRYVWWHHRSMPGKCPCRKQWARPTSVQYACSIELATSETRNNQEEKCQQVTEEIIMLRLRMPLWQDIISLIVKKRFYLSHRIYVFKIQWF